MINGATIGDKLRDPKGKLAQLIGAGASSRAIIEYVYWAALSHAPPENELAAWSAEADQVPDRRAFLEDIWWAVMNSDEFLFRR